MKNSRNYVVLAVLLAALVISIPLYVGDRIPGKEALVSKLPMDIQGWSGRDLPVDERAYEILETHNLILREYQKAGRKVYIYIVYSSDNRKVSHPPEVCFEGSGVTIVEKNKIEIPLAEGTTKANQLIVEQSDAINVVLYWYKAGSFYTDNYLKQQLTVALDHMKMKKTSGALIRVSAEAPSGDSKQAMANIEEFVKAVSAYFPSVIP